MEQVSSHPIKPSTTSFENRACHGREIALLRKELQLEQRRTESLAREVNLLRANDTANFVTRRGSKRDLVASTMSSLQDRVRKEMDEAH